MAELAPALLRRRGLTACTVTYITLAFAGLVLPHHPWLRDQDDLSGERRYDAVSCCAVHAHCLPLQLF